MPTIDLQATIHFGSADALAQEERALADRLRTLHEQGAIADFDAAFGIDHAELTFTLAYDADQLSWTAMSPAEVSAVVEQWRYDNYLNQREIDYRVSDFPHATSLATRVKIVFHDEADRLAEQPAIENRLERLADRGVRVVDLAANGPTLLAEIDISNTQLSYDPPSGRFDDDFDDEGEPVAHETVSVVIPSDDDFATNSVWSVVQEQLEEWRHSVRGPRQVICTRR